MYKSELKLLDFKPVAHGGAIALSVVFILSTQITLSQV